mmetsp:Transcript_5290/g.10446  ORF Transcript_5290/g.10446 Transcript_5290/m.10446 type:complete len:645 (-) Transcript_5290:43-1977(-)
MTSGTVSHESQAFVTTGQVSKTSENEKPIEDERSWELHQERLLQQDQESGHGRRLHYFTKDERPKIQYDTQHALMIDAGSQGTRLHVYEFEARTLSTHGELKDVVTGRRLSFPTTDTRWTNRMKPGLDVFAFVVNDEEMRNQVKFYLSPLLQFAKDVLHEKKEYWQHYPIYLKATGGLRALPAPYRLRLMESVRALFNDTAFNPFFFEVEHARVISGEEEAIYGWAAVNFVKGTLLRNSEGTGSVLNPGRSYGVLEMGGASTQIAFFQPNGDVMANLFKLQIGSSKHWNVYAHSFLYFGINGAFERLNARLIVNAAMTSNQTNSRTLGVYNPCLPGGSHYLFTSRVKMLPDYTLIPLSSPTDRSVLEVDMYSELMSNDNAKGDPAMCEEMVYRLLRKEANAWCNFAHDRDCSFAGIYQPPLPLGSHDFKEFIVSSNFVDVFSFLQLGNTSDLASVRQAARSICYMSLYELQVYNSKLPHSISDVDDLVQYCFRATFVASFLIEGIGFPPEANVTAIDVIDGQKLGWALGSTLYEINTLPWEFEGSLLKKVERAEEHENQNTIMMDMAGKWDGESGKRVFDLVRQHRGVSIVVTLLVSFIAFFARRTPNRRRCSRLDAHGEAIVLLNSQGHENNEGNSLAYGSNY